MSTATQDRPTVNESHGSYPTISTRYDPRLVEWATDRLRISKAELVKRALDDLMAKIMRAEAPVETGARS
jgi:hypothetical protein